MSLSQYVFPFTPPAGGRRHHRPLRFPRCLRCSVPWIRCLPSLRCLPPMSPSESQTVPDISQEPMSRHFPLSLVGASAVILASLPAAASPQGAERSEEHTSELQSQSNLVCRLLLEKKKKKKNKKYNNQKRTKPEDNNNK